MRILVLGAGGIGGYFGGRLVENHKNVTFLVRPKRKSDLERNGLVIHSENGDYSITPVLTTKEDKAEPSYVILLYAQFYVLKKAIDHMTQFVRAHTVMIRVFNAVAQIQKLQAVNCENKIMGEYYIIETA